MQGLVCINTLDLTSKGFPLKDTGSTLEIEYLNTQAHCVNVFWFWAHQVPLMQVIRTKEPWRPLWGGE